MSQFQSLGLTIQVYQPEIDLPTSYDPEANYLGTLSREVESYSHTSGAFGGYLSANIGLKIPRTRIDEWLAYGLNRSIVVYNPNLMRIWEGFVNQITVSLGPLTVTRGPLLGIGNRVSVQYTRIANTTDARPSLTGQAITAIADDTASQALYGIVERIENGGQLDDVAADQLRDAFIQEHAWPIMPKSLSSSGSEPSVTLDCLGHLARLGAVTYENTTAGFSTITAKIGAVLDDDPNKLFASTNADLFVNNLVVPTAEEQLRLPLDVLKELTAFGDPVTYGRTILGAYNNRRVVYELASTVIDYHYALADPGMRVTTPAGLLVRPWDVRPGRNVLYTDFLIGATLPGTIKTDPRVQFIESVTFRAPYEISLEGSWVTNIPQMMAQYGLGGTSA